MTRRWMMAGSFLLCLGGTRAAVADPIVIESGAMFYVEADATSGIHLEGQDFKLVSDNNFIDPTFFDITALCSGGPGSFGCMPGDIVPLNVISLGSDFGSLITLDGQTFATPDNSEATRGNALVSFQGEFTAPPFPGPTGATVKAPFTFEGLVFPPSSFSDSTTRSLVGDGTATVRLAWLDGGWKLQRVDYLFGSAQPIPEPTTLLLVGSGTLAAVVSRRRKTVRQR